MISSADFVDLFPSKNHAEIRDHHRVGFERPGKDCDARRKDSGEAVQEKSSVAESNPPGIMLARQLILQPLTAITRLYTLSTLVACGPVTATLVVSSKLLNADPRSGIGLPTGQRKNAGLITVRNMAN